MTGEAFTAFYQREWSAAVRFGWVLTGSREEAEDLAQDAFVAARNAWGRIEGYERPDGWLRRAMTNRSISRRRRLTREARARLRLGPQLSVSVALPAESDHVWAAVRRLPDRQMHVIALTYLDDRPDQDIAKILGIGLETVRTHRRRARARLAELLDTEHSDTELPDTELPSLPDTTPAERIELL